MRTRGLASAGAAVGLLFLAGCSSSKPTVEDSGPPDAGPTCQVRADCPTGWICQAADAGSDAGADAGGANFCAHCTTNGQCQPDETCDPINLVCQFLPGWGNQCKLNGDCSLGQFCLQGLCAPPDKVTLCTMNKCPPKLRCQIQNQVCEQDLGCFSDADCTSDQVCNTATRLCELRCTPETVGSVCPAHWQCVNSRCVDCLSDADCGAGLTCNQAAGRCTSPSLCYTNADCPAGQVCNPVSQSCGPPPPPCKSNQDCLKTQVCDVTSGQCVSAACLPDLYDPNATLSAGAAIASNTAYKNLTLCGPTEQDWFSINLQSGDLLYVNVTTDVTGAGYRFVVALVASNGAILTPTKLGTLQVTATIATAGTYYLRMTSGDATAYYGFSVQVSHGQPCPPDAFDPNGTPLEAKTFDGGTGPIYLCAGEEDWYLAAALPAQPFQATLVCDPTQGALALTLYDSDTTTVLDQKDLGLPTQTVTTTKPAGGPVYLKVSGDGRNTNSYQLSSP
jgi:hypothetical protein